MKMHPVKSSKIDVICYDEQTHKLRVSFREEQPRDFCHVPENTFTAFLNARSKNRFFKRNIEDSFPCWASTTQQLYCRVHFWNNEIPFINNNHTIWRDDETRIWGQQICYLLHVRHDGVRIYSYAAGVKGGFCVSCLKPSNSSTYTSGSISWNGRWLMSLSGLHRVIP